MMASISVSPVQEVSKVKIEICLTSSRNRKLFQRFDCSLGGGNHQTCLKELYFTAFSKFYEDIFHIS